MAYANGKIYIDTESTPNIGVSIYDIQQALGIAARNDIGGIITYAEAHDLMNEYAKYKPFRDSSHNPTAEVRKSKNYGLYIPYYRLIGTMVGDIINNRWTNAENYDALRTPWGWEAPRGGGQTPKEWFRVLDFNGYNANAQPMAGQVSSPVLVPVNDNSASFLFPYHYDPLDIAPSDIVEPGGLFSTARYLGVCLFTGTGANQRKVYTFGAVGNYDSESIHSLIASWNPASPGLYNACLFISDREIEVGDSDTNGAYIPILPSITTNILVQLETWNLSNLVVEADQLGRAVGVSWSVTLGNTISGTKQATVTCVYYYDDNGVEREYATETQTVNLQSGSNSGDCDKSNVMQILSRVVVSVDITDAVHGNGHINQQAYVTQF